MSQKNNFNKFGARGPRKHFDKKQGFRKKPFQQNSKEYRHTDQLQETDVGITKFISELPGFSGIIKARFSDFQVSEIDLNGQVAKLTNLSIPEEFKRKPVVDDSVDTTNSPLETIPQAVWDEIKSLLDAPSEKSVELDSSNLTKEDRIKIHECLRQMFGGKIYSNTVNEDDKKSMIFKKSDGKNGDGRMEWPKDVPEYVHFLLYKESLDTLEACMKVADCLRMSPSNFTYAGVKDKRSKSTQWLSVRKVSPLKLAKTGRLFNVKIGNITFKETPMKLGQLLGNKFRIALRNVVGDDELIQNSLQHLKEKGFINYYGLQRFGNNKEVPTFSIGIQLLLGNWKEACKIILKPVKSDHPSLDISKAKKSYHDTENAAEALKEFDENKNKCIEYCLLTGLSKGHENEFVNALESIPRNTRLLYIHSFQSLVWNLAVSERIEKYGLDVVPGDLVLLEDGNKDLDEETCDEENEEDSNSQHKKNKVKVLTAEDCGNFSIYDVVLPLPGYDIIYPAHLKDFYRETLEKYGLTLEMPKQKVQTYTLSGTYRKMLEQVKDLSWKVMHYDDPNYNLIRSDLEELRGGEEPQDVEGGQYKALILEFSLTSSSYATMVLRELLKTDTSSSSHAKLNNYHEVKGKVVTVKSKESEQDNNEEKGDSLLANAAQFEAFKNVIFNNDSETSKKRKNEDESEEPSKIIKVDES